MFMRIAWRWLGFLQGLIKERLNHARHTGGFLKWWQITPGRPERDLSAAIMKVEREEAG